MITLELFGDPVPLARPRLGRKNGRSSVYDSQKKIKEGYQWQIKSQFRRGLLTVPLKLDLLFFMPVPKSTPKRKANQMINGVLAHTKKPDLDNLIKFVLDCFNNFVFQDDSQVMELRAKKLYAEKPGTLIRVIPLADDKEDLLYENCAREKRS